MRKILVVDSDNHVADLCRFTLGRHGHEVFCVHNGEEAVAVAQNITFDLVVADSMLEGMSGTQTFLALRQENPTLEGILLTSHTSMEKIVEAMEQGLSRVCSKPLHPRELVAAVEASLRLSALREDITRMRTLLPLYDLGEQFFAADTEQAVYEALVEAVVGEMNVRLVSVMMLDPTDGLLKIAAFRGLKEDVARGVAMQPGEGIAGKVFLSRSPAIFNKADQHRSPYADSLKRKELSAAISFPIVSRGKVMGVLNVGETADRTPFSDADVEMLSIISSQAMMALKNVRLIREREKTSRMQGILEQYVSPEVSNLLMNSPMDPLEVGSIQELTVLFADMRNFTFLVQHLQLETLRSFLNSFFALFSRVVFSSQGMLDKFMGDAVLAIFGAPVPLDNPCQAAVTAAEKVLDEFHRLRQYWIEKDPIFEKVGLGIAISRGPMFLGNVGSRQRLDFTVIGTDVNIAQRLAAEAVSGQILITDRVYRRLDDQFEVRMGSHRRLRGMEFDVMVYALPIAGKPDIAAAERQAP